MQEQGKPLAEATAEIAYSEYWIRTMSAYDIPTKVIEESKARPGRRYQPGVEPARPAAAPPAGATDTIKDRK